MLTSFEYSLLRRIATRLPSTMDGGAYTGKSKLRVLLPGIEAEIRDKVVLDFGCGPGAEAKVMALLGANRVIGLDISEKWLRVAREQAEKAGIAGRCEFVSRVESPVEVIVSFDSFEHFAEPDAVLQAMYSLLEPGGCAFISFGPTLVSSARRPFVFCFPMGPCCAEGKGSHSMESSIQKRRSGEVQRSRGWTESNDDSPVRRASQEELLCRRAIRTCSDPATKVAA